MNARQMLSQCLKKKAYSTPEFAERVASRRKQESGIDLYWYICSLCGRVHLTKRKEWKR
jgi:hypothetical protein